MAIEIVALNGTTEPFRMGAVHAQLVSAAREWMQIHNMFSNNAIQRHSWFTVLFIHPLKWTVHYIGCKRQFNTPFLA